jgi:hypothetical protein
MYIYDNISNIFTPEQGESQYFSYLSYLYVSNFKISSMILACKDVMFDNFIEGDRFPTLVNKQFSNPLLACLISSYPDTHEVIG